MRPVSSTVQRPLDGPVVGDQGGGKSGPEPGWGPLGVIRDRVESAGSPAVSAMLWKRK